MQHSQWGNSSLMTQRTAPFVHAWSGMFQITMAQTLSCKAAFPHICWNVYRALFACSAPMRALQPAMICSER